MDEQSRTTLKLDLASITDFQKEFHYGRKLKDGNSDPEDPVDSRFSYEFNKSTWSAHIVEKMQASNQNKSIIYRPSNKYDFLFGCTMRAIIPQIKIAPKWRGKIRIRWTRNLGHHIFKKANLKLDSNIVGTLTPQWLDARASRYESRPHIYNRMIGETPKLNSWSEERLPGFLLNIPQPWFYTKDTYLALPILGCSMNVIEHEYEFRLSIAKLLQVQGRANKESDDWQPIEFQNQYIEGNPEIPIPELWGRFAQVMNDEREWHRQPPSTYMIEDIVTASPENIVREGKCATITLSASLPCKAYFWMAQNGKADKYNNYSNYTTDPFDLDFGWNPCKNTIIKYKGADQPRAEFTDDQSEFSDLYDFYPGGGTQPGYNSCTNCYDVETFHSEPGVVPLNVAATMVIQIDETNPYNFDESPTIVDEVDEDGNPIPPEFAPKNDKKTKNEYNVFVIMLVTKKLEFRHHAERDKIEYKVVDTALPIDKK